MAGGSQPPPKAGVRWTTRRRYPRISFDPRLFPLYPPPQSLPIKGDTMVLLPQNLLSEKPAPSSANTKTSVHWRPQHSRAFRQLTGLSCLSAARHWVPCHALRASRMPIRRGHEPPVRQYCRPRRTTDIDQDLYIALIMATRAVAFAAIMFLTLSKTFWADLPPVSRYNVTTVQILKLWPVPGTTNADILHSADTLNAHVEQARRPRSPAR